VVGAAIELADAAHGMSEDRQPETAYEVVTPVCPCGRALEKPWDVHLPTETWYAVRCGCGRAVRARFWRRQEDRKAL